MKKTILLLLSVVCLQFSRADEGMWTLFNLPDAVYQTMQTEGFALGKGKLYGDNDAIMRSVVNFSGYCSGVVVSPDGLVFTNHHCGFEAIRSHSTVEHDYMLNGFFAKTQEEELPNEGMFVAFMREQEDVTDKVLSYGYNYKDDKGKQTVLDSLTVQLTKKAKAKDSTYYVDIDEFYEGNRFIATTYQMFTDLRLVFTVPKSMGKFGGETDNWMWPRQTSDFSVFRIYADPKTNGPASYKKENVPYHPEKWAQVSLDGYKDGDFAMTMGYPGSTSRYLSSYGIQERRSAQNEPRAQVRGMKQEVMWRHMLQDEAVRIKYDSKYAQSANYWKNSIGMNKCIDSIGIIAQKQAFEGRIRHYLDSTKRETKLDFALMERLYGKRFDIARNLTLFTETFRSNELSKRALKYGMGMEVKGSQNNEKKQYVTFKDNSQEWDKALDEEVLGTLLKNYQEKASQQYLPDFYTTTIANDFQGDPMAYAKALYDGSVLMQSGKKIYFARKKTKADLGAGMSADLNDVWHKLYEGYTALSDSIDEQEKLLCAAILLMESDQPHYSDANFTLRLSYGQVGGFMLSGKPSGYYTKAESIVEKMKLQNTIPDYKAEPIMQELMSAKDFGQYKDKRTGDMHLCFLTNNDITGGNSGSPMFNGKGELIGLAFDGNWDSLSSDIHFDRQLARCIGVDIRYVVYLMDRWGKADRLLKELGLK